MSISPIPLAATMGICGCFVGLCFGMLFAGMHIISAYVNQTTVHILFATHLLLTPAIILGVIGVASGALFALMYNVMTRGKRKD